MKISRRDLGKLALSGLAPASAFAGANSFYRGVQMGICSYSFRGMGLDALIGQMTAVPMGQLELESVFVEPARGGRGQTPEQRAALRRWRLTVALDEIRAVRRRLDDAGIDVYAYNIPVDDTFTEDELDRVFLMARLLGARVVNSAALLPSVPLLAAAAERHNMRVGLHPSTFGPGMSSEGAIGSLESYREAFAISPLIGANPDLNGWRAWGPDPLYFVRAIAGRITTLHTHDSKPTDTRPAGVPFGTGSNPIREVLQLMRKEKYTFVAMLERLYALPEGGDNVAELRKCLRYCQSALQS